jgi:hypothetical protein
MDTSQHLSPAKLVARLFEIQRMTTGDLRAELERLSGNPCSTWNRTYLVRKVSALVQVDLAKNCRASAPAASSPSADQEPPSIPHFRDRRLPAIGAEIVKVYKGHEIRVRVTPDGFEYFGTRFGSLTAVAKAITRQQSINGMLFFRLARRNRAK